MWSFIKSPVWATVHYAHGLPYSENLTNGKIHEPTCLQSTRCKQKSWPTILRFLTHQLLHFIQKVTAFTDDIFMSTSSSNITESANYTKCAVFHGDVYKCVSYIYVIMVAVIQGWASVITFHVPSCDIPCIQHCSQISA